MTKRFDAIRTIPHRRPIGRPVKAAALALAAGALVACEPSGTNGGSVPSDVRVMLRSGEAICQVDSARLDDARRRFGETCGDQPRDCDPHGDGWRCSSAIIGAAAPPSRGPEALGSDAIAGDDPADVATDPSPFVEGFDVAEQWNELTLAAIRAGAAKPTLTAHQLFMVSTAMYDALAIHSDVPTPYALSDRARRAPAERTAANRREAVSVAAYTMLTALFPDFEAEHGHFGAYLERLGYRAVRAVDASPSGFGFAAAIAVMAERGNDGSGFLDGFGEVISPIYPEAYAPVNPPRPIGALDGFGPGFDPNRWQPLRVPNGTLLDEANRPLVDDLNLDSFGDQRFLSPSWGALTPFALAHGAELRPPPPPRHGSDAPYTDGLGRSSTHHEAWVAQFTDVVRFSAELDDRGKFIAEFWADGPRTESPPGHWNQLAHGIVARDSLPLEESVPLFFALNGALLDASIATWEAKRFYDYVRPATAIRFLFRGTDIEAWGGPDRGTETIRGEDWSPYQKLDFVTPPFPEYVSGHSTFSRASAEVLTRFVARREGLDPNDPIAGRFYDGSSRTRQDIDGDGELDLLGEFTAPVGSFVIEAGPVEPVVLRWHTFRGAADEAGLSRLYGGIHIQDGDLRGRELGRRVGRIAFDAARRHMDGEIPEQ